MGNYLLISDNFAKFVAWIGGSCKPSDKGKLTPFPHFTFCQHNFNNVSSMLSYEELPEINSERWLSVEDFPEEEWRDVVGYEERLSISNYGRIKRKSIKVTDSKGKVYYFKEKIYKQRELKWTHQVVIVSIGLCKTKGFLIHRAVAQAFIPNPDNLPFINHKDENPRNNTVSNLEWCTALYNSNYGNCREKIKMSKVYNGIAKSIILYNLNGDVLKRYYTESDAKRDLGISKYIIKLCCEGKYPTACGLYVGYEGNYNRKIEYDSTHSYAVKQDGIYRELSSFNKEEISLLIDKSDSLFLLNNIYKNGKKNRRVKKLELVQIGEQNFLLLNKGKTKTYIYLK